MKNIYVYLSDVSVTKKVANVCAVFIIVTVGDNLLAVTNRYRWKIFSFSHERFTRRVPIGGMYDAPFVFVVDFIRRSFSHYRRGELETNDCVSKCGKDSMIGVLIREGCREYYSFRWSASDENLVMKVPILNAWVVRSTRSRILRKTLGSRISRKYLHSNFTVEKAKVMSRGREQVSPFYLHFTPVIRTINHLFVMLFGIQ